MNTIPRIQGRFGHPQAVHQPNAHLICLPQAHRQASEDAVNGEKIGTTGRGIGPAYADKANRTGMRAGELFETGLEQKVHSWSPRKT